MHFHEPPKIIIDNPSLRTSSYEKSTSLSSLRMEENKDEEKKILSPVREINDEEDSEDSEMEELKTIREEPEHLEEDHSPPDNEDLSRIIAPNVFVTGTESKSSHMSNLSTFIPDCREEDKTDRLGNSAQ